MKSKGWLGKGGTMTITEAVDNAPFVSVGGPVTLSLLEQCLQSVLDVR